MLQLFNFERSVFHPESRMDSFQEQLSEAMRKYLVLDQDTNLPPFGSGPVEWANIDTSCPFFTQQHIK